MTDTPISAERLDELEAACKRTRDIASVGVQLPVGELEELCRHYRSHASGGRDAVATTKPEPNPEWEAKAAALHRATMEEVAESGGGPGSLQDALTMLDRWTADAEPANEHGQVSFSRAIMQSVAESIRAHLATPSTGSAGTDPVTVALLAATIAPFTASAPASVASVPEGLRQEAETLANGFHTGWYSEVSRAEVIGRCERFAKGVLPFLLAAPKPPAMAGRVETLETIAAWGLETFGPNQDLNRYLDRTDEEMAELREAVAAGDGERAAMEGADVIIMLSRLTTSEHVNRKMAVNRAREWRLVGDGTGYHVTQPVKTGE